MTDKAALQAPLITPLSPQAQDSIPVGCYPSHIPSTPTGVMEDAAVFGYEDLPSGTHDAAAAGTSTRVSAPQHRRVEWATIAALALLGLGIMLLLMSPSLAAHPTSPVPDLLGTVPPGILLQGGANSPLGFGGTFNGLSDKASGILGRWLQQVVGKQLAHKWVWPLDVSPQRRSSIAAPGGDLSVKVVPPGWSGSDSSSKADVGPSSMQLQELLLMSSLPDAAAISNLPVLVEPVTDGVTLAAPVTSPVTTGGTHSAIPAAAAPLLEQPALSDGVTVTVSDMGADGLHLVVHTGDTSAPAGVPAMNPPILEDQQLMVTVQAVSELGDLPTTTLALTVPLESIQEGEVLTVEVTTSTSTTTTTGAWTTAAAGGAVGAVAASVQGNRRAANMDAVKQQDKLLDSALAGAPVPASSNHLASLTSRAAGSVGLSQAQLPPQRSVSQGDYLALHQAFSAALLERASQPAPSGSSAGRSAGSSGSVDDDAYPVEGGLQQLQLEFDTYEDAYVYYDIRDELGRQGLPNLGATDLAATIPRKKPGSLQTQIPEDPDWELEANEQQGALQIQMPVVPDGKWEATEEQGDLQNQVPEVPDWELGAAVDGWETAWEPTWGPKATEGGWQAAWEPEVGPTAAAAGGWEAGWESKVGPTAAAAELAAEPIYTPPDVADVAEHLGYHDTFTADTQGDITGDELVTEPGDDVSELSPSPPSATGSAQEYLRESLVAANIAGLASFTNRRLHGFTDLVSKLLVPTPSPPPPSPKPSSPAPSPKPSPSTSPVPSPPPTSPKPKPPAANTTSPTSNITLIPGLTTTNISAPIELNSTDGSSGHLGNSTALMPSDASSLESKLASDAAGARVQEPVTVTMDLRGVLPETFSVVAPRILKVLVNLAAITDSWSLTSLAPLTTATGSTSVSSGRRLLATPGQVLGVRALYLVNTTSQKLVGFRLSQPAASSSSSSCSTLLCQRLVEAGVPVDVNSILVVPDGLAIITQEQQAAAALAAEQAAAAARRNAILAGVAAAIGGLALLLVCWKVLLPCYRRRLLAASETKSLAREKKDAAAGFTGTFLAPPPEVMTAARTSPEEQYVAAEPSENSFVKRIPMAAPQAVDRGAPAPPHPTSSFGAQASPLDHPHQQARLTGLTPVKQPGAAGTGAAARAGSFNWTQRSDGSGSRILSVLPAAPVVDFYDEEDGVLVHTGTGSVEWSENGSSSSLAGTPGGIQIPADAVGSLGTWGSSLSPWSAMIPPATTAALLAARSTAADIATTVYTGYPTAGDSPNRTEEGPLPASQALEGGTFEPSQYYGALTQRAASRAADAAPPMQYSGVSRQTSAALKRGSS